MFLPSFPFTYTNFMKVKISYMLIVFMCLNGSNGIPYNSEMSHQNDYYALTKVRRGKKITRKNFLYKESKHQLSITLRGISCNSGVGLINSRVRGFLLSLFSFNFSYTHWFNNYVGIVGSCTLIGDAYLSFTDKKMYLSLLEPGIGIEWSYNGRGGNKDGKICYSGGFMINILWIGVVEQKVSGRNVFGFCFKYTEVGLNVGLIPFRVSIPTNGFTFAINALDTDIGRLMVGNLIDKLKGLGIGNLLYLKLTFGKTWWI